MKKQIRHAWFMQAKACCLVVLSMVVSDQRVAERGRAGPPGRCGLLAESG
ncbi:hypothetical protein B0G83_12071 [Paraburkholderia sp. BL21I4N1]|nr:hypothetical protein B0G83_12071 [Paraburkholderia sp. BL21I4N1]